MKLNRVVKWTYKKTELGLLILKVVSNLALWREKVHIQQKKRYSVDGFLFGFKKSVAKRLLQKECLLSAL
jgi:hypothetical protein